MKLIYRTARTGSWDSGLTKKLPSSVKTNDNVRRVDEAMQNKKRILRYFSHPTETVHHMLRARKQLCRARGTAASGASCAAFFNFFFQHTPGERPIIIKSIHSAERSRPFPPRMLMSYCSVLYIYSHHFASARRRRHHRLAPHHRRHSFSLL